ncbi:MAG: hypothetical protein KGM18_09185 [Sphingomonadales bacterium]|nr:hypothetical protein [Sphingomonadales bacterium]
MNPFLHLIAPLVLMLPAAVAVDEARGPLAADPLADQSADLAVTPAPVSRASGEALRTISDYFQPAEAQQVRIEERITIRVAPRPAPMQIMPSMFEQDFAPPPGMPRYIEKKMGKCVPVTGIVGVQPAGGNRLIMMMKDRRTVSASLSKSCQAQAYYSGFLVAKNADGMICQGRDQLLARNGTNCTVTGFRQIIEQGD